MEYIIETEMLVKEYGKNAVVDSINLHVPRGKIYALLGRNGAGKTTAMKMMLQLVQPSGGAIRLFGEDFRENTREIFRKIGSIIETPGFYGNLTAYENLALLGRLRGERKKSKIRESLELVGLQNEYAKPFADYSLGMKQRLGIAASIMHSPELLILDEPINGLDPIGISEIRSFLSELSQVHGKTILISSHVLSELEQIADYVGVMHKGRLIEEVDTKELRKGLSTYIQLQVSDVRAAGKLLEAKWDIKNYSLSGNTVQIYDRRHSSGEINRAFVENGLLVEKINLHEEKLEDYFSGLIGGGGIA